jgi:hypothetical protein
MAKSAGTMLVPPRKKSYGVDYPNVLSRFLSSTYSPQEATDNREAIKALSEMRAQALSVSEVGGCAHPQAHMGYSRCCAPHSLNCMLPYICA